MYSFEVMGGRFLDEEWEPIEGRVLLPGTREIHVEAHLSSTADQVDAVVSFEPDEGSAAEQASIVLSRIGSDGSSGIYQGDIRLAPGSSSAKMASTAEVNAPGSGTVQLAVDDVPVAEIRSEQLTVTVTDILFNHDPTSATTDGLNLRKNRDDPLDYPEFSIDRSAEQWMPAAYVMDQPTTVAVRFKIDGLSETVRIRIKGKSNDLVGSLGDTEEKTITFQNGTSTETHTGEWNPDVPAADEFVLLTIEGTTPANIQKTSESWMWLVTGIALGPDGEGTVIPIEPAEEHDITGPHTVFVLFGEPISPWAQEDPLPRQPHPWVTALEFAFQAIGTQLLSDNYSCATSCLIRECYRRGPPTKGDTAVAWISSSRRRGCGACGKMAQFWRACFPQVHSPRGNIVVRQPDRPR